MAESFDFDQIAQAIVATLPELAAHDLIRQDSHLTARAEAAVHEALRLAWNARGAADLVKLETHFSGTGTLQTIARALRALDR
jgi:hypothetical protein